MDAYKLVSMLATVGNIDCVECAQNVAGFKEDLAKELTPAYEAGNWARVAQIAKELQELTDIVDMLTKVATEM